MVGADVVPGRGHGAAGRSGRGWPVMAWESTELTVPTQLAGRRVAAVCELVPMTRLRVGDRFLGIDPRQRVYRVQGWRRGSLLVLDEPASASELRAAVRRGDVEPGATPGEGLFTASTVRVASVKRVVRIGR